VSVHLDDIVTGLFTLLVLMAIAKFCSRPSPCPKCRSRNQHLIQRAGRGEWPKEMWQCNQCGERIGRIWPRR
jgi:hypothetical protein